ncbi:hypothetical protein ACWEJ6_41020 [Nonomuraea sp. NPDC004702]
MANKMLAKLWHCPRNGVPYNEAVAWPRPLEAKPLPPLDISLA